MNPRLHVLSLAELTVPQFAAIGQLMSVVWPGKVQAERSQDEMGEFVAQVRQRDGIFAIALDDDGSVIAHSSIFSREILLPTGRTTVGALAGVCCHPNWRNRGLGRDVVRATFARVDEGQFSVSFFQTGVPGFYEKIGARLVHNRCFNSFNAEDPTGNPWWEPHLMVYPALYPWPDGEIDLLGRGW